MLELVTQYQDSLIAWAAKNGMNIALALLVILIGHIVARTVANGLRRALEHRKVDALLGNFLRGVAYYMIMAAVFIAAAAQAGIDTTSFVAILGTVGLAVGLALKDNLANFSSGVMLVLFRPFTYGDYVQAAGTAGSVEAINLFHTVLRSPDNQKIIVPNSLIMGTVITNVTGNTTRRIDLVIGVSYSDDLARTREVIENVLKAEPRVLADPAYTIAVNELADSSVNFVVRPWVKTEEYWSTRWSLMEAIKIALDANGISIPFPQRDVHVIQENSVQEQ